MNPVSNHQIQPELSVENGQAGTGRDSRTRLARPKFQILGANGGIKRLFFPVQLTTSRIGNLTRLKHTPLYDV